jgi:SpoIID/LytB domain protein
VTFGTKDTVVVRPNAKKNVQEVLVANKVVASAAGALRVTWTGTGSLTGRAATVQVTGSGRYGSHQTQPYRYGELAVSRTPAGTTLNVVNVVRLDDYLKGLAEMPFSWGINGAAALQAQALAARTYAYKALLGGTSSGCACHLYDGINSQVFGGYGVETGLYGDYWADAVSRTANSVITNGGRPIEATYYSASGGRTMDVHDVWGSTLSYLRSVSDSYSLKRTVSGHAVGNPNVSWTATVSQARMAQVMGLSRVLKVQITGWTSGHTPSQLTATSTTGQKVVRTFSSSEQLRGAFGLKAPWVGSITAH